jgi:hypothetical protein
MAIFTFMQNGSTGAWVEYVTSHMYDTQANVVLLTKHI